MHGPRTGINNDVKVLGIIGDGKGLANTAACWCELMKGRVETPVTEWRESEKAMADARCAKETAEKEPSWGYFTRLCHLG